MNPQQIKAARAMLAKAGLNEDNKKDLVYSHTDGRTESLKAMLPHEAKSFFKVLEGMLPKGPPSPADKMRNKIISLGHEMKWHQPGTRKIDMARVDGWCTDKFGAALDKLPYLDLCHAVTAFEKVHFSYLKGI